MFIKLDRQEALTLNKTYSSSSSSILKAESVMMALTCVKIQQYFKRFKSSTSSTVPHRSPRHPPHSSWLCPLKTGLLLTVVWNASAQWHQHADYQTSKWRDRKPNRQFSPKKKFFYRIKANVLPHKKPLLAQKHRFLAEVHPHWSAEHGGEEWVEKLFVCLLHYPDIWKGIGLIYLLTMISSYIIVR